MDDLVECVPNFSEGREPRAIQGIVEAIGSVDGVAVLDVDSGWSANRTVVTFVGASDRVVEGAFRGMEAACRLIDMRRHQGTHWRQGATDVCPFVPLYNVTMQKCVELARSLGRRAAMELGVPVCLYGEASETAATRELAAVRRGGYERLARRLQTGALRPDYGGPQVNPRSGLSAVGARELLVAYNVNLVEHEEGLARSIARQIRTSALGGTARGALETPHAAPLAHCQARGWLVAEYGCAQVTANLTNYRVTGLHDIYERVKQLAQARGSAVNGSEIVGMVPLAALLAAGRYYARGVERPIDGEPDLLRLAEQELGLSAVRPFERRRKVLEYRLEDLGLWPFPAVH